MNTFYNFEYRNYETLQEVEKATKNYTNKKFDVIKTEKTFDDFDEAYANLRKEDNSILDAIEWAK